MRLNAAGLIARRRNLGPGDRVKLVVHVPLSHADVVRQAMGDAGGGKLGEYSHCTFSVRGIGRYKPSDSANPFIGQPGEYSSVEEERIEMPVDRSVLSKVIAAMKKAHPYEEVVYDVIALENS